MVTLIIAGLFVQTTYFDKFVLRADTLATASNRTLFWEIADDYIARRPNLGHGFASDRYIHEHYGTNLRSLGLRGYGVMSSYYGLAIQMGWPLTVIFFGLIWVFALYCIITYWKDYALVTLSATLMSGLIISIFENTLYSAGNLFSFLFWVWFMLAIRRLRHKRRFKRTGISKVLLPQPHPSGIDRKNSVSADCVGHS
jgi:O-antigen ligase